MKIRKSNNTKKPGSFSNVILTTVAGLLITIASVSVTKADAGGDAEKFFKAQNKKVLGLLKQKPSDARSTKLDGLLSNLLDYESLAKKALAKEWDKRSEAEQKEFVSVLKQLVSKNYRNNLKTTASYNLKYKGHEDKGSNVLVKTLAKSKTDKRAPAIALDYLMTRTGKTWKVVDIITDGVSLVENYRKQFKKIVKKKGFDGLLAKMKSKLNS